MKVGDVSTRCGMYSYKKRWNVCSVCVIYMGNFSERSS